MEEPREIDDPRWERAHEAIQANDYAGALFLFKAMAKDGIKDAYTKIGYTYSLGGYGVDKNHGEAIKWLRKAYYEVDDAWAAIGLGRSYYYGQGVKKDYADARKYFYEAARIINIDIANLMLGRIYHDGLGVEKDLAKAYYFYRRAAAKGNLVALFKLGWVIHEKGEIAKGACVRYRAAREISKVKRKNPKDSRLRDLPE